MEDKPLELLLVRHAECYMNRDGTGGLDSELTELGIEQANCLAPWLASSFQVQALYASPLKRARQTAEIIAVALKQEIRFRDDLREVDFELGPLMPRLEDPASAIGRVGFPVGQMPAAYVEFHNRVVQAFREIVAEQRKGTVAVVTHGGVISVLMRAIFGSHQVSIWADNTSVFLLRWMNSRWYTVFTNQCEHLDRSLRT